MKLLLVVEDDDDLRGALAAVFAHAGYRVEAVRDGAIAWERVQLEPRPSAVVLDLTMPRVDGATLRRRMLDRLDTRAIPVIVCTGSVEDPQLPACTVLRKPVDIDELLATVERALRRPDTLEA